MMRLAVCAPARCPAERGRPREVPSRHCHGDDGHVQETSRGSSWEPPGLLQNDGAMCMFFLRRCWILNDTNYSVLQSAQAKNFLSLSPRASRGISASIWFK